MTLNAKTTTSFWIIGIVALLWNIMGVIAYLGQAFITEKALALLPEAEQAYYLNVPAWVTSAFATAVFAGTLVCIALLIKKKWATSLFIVSLIAVIVQSVYSFFIQTDMDVTAEKAIMPIFIIVMAFFLVWYSKGASKKGILS